MKNLPDQIYIEQLRQRLWSNRGLGRAAVMIGSGFSRNADALSPGMPLFPLWSELARAMATDLYPSAGNAKANKDPLRLATEYESVFGRDALNTLTVRVVPDANYKPGLLHQMLMSLPWSDVFTTNYDTLLERTLPDITDRKYDIVLTSSDLTSRVKPRIVKLHGSFPSYLPFIVTQEDFRTYPHRFAPFVNTVQQSIIENAFLLLGFSGEDPNFLNWTGWVRDNLGELSPPIYFCSLFEVSSSERRVLEKRNIFPIDLSQIIDQNEIPDDNVRFTKMLEWFLLELLNGEPLNNLHYPSLIRKTHWTASHGVPLPSTGNTQENDLGAISPSGFNHHLDENELKEITNRWREQRENYPGWVVLPTDNRERLWKYTEYWIDPLLNSLNSLPTPTNLSLIYELNWRLEKCLLPIPNARIAESYQQTLSNFNPFPTLLNQEAEFRPDNNAGFNFNWNEISYQWTELTFALLRQAREQFNDTGFQEIIEKLREIVKQNNDWQARWFYEQCLFALFRLDHEAVRRILPEWDTNLSDSFWRAKRAAILAEIGEIDQAEKETEEALANIRSRQQPSTYDYTLFSQEGWLLVLLKGIKDNRIFGGNKLFVDEYRDRWEQLGIYRCNPWIDLENFELKIENLDLRFKPVRSTVKGFSPGKETVNYIIASSSEAEKARLALSFLRMFEQSGLPFRSNRVTNFSEAITKAAICLADSDLEQTVSTIIRIEKTDDINDWFHRYHVKQLSEATVNRFFVLFSNSFADAVGRYQLSLGSEAGDTAFRRIKLFAELLSRICFRLPAEQLETVFTYAERIYKNPLFTQNVWLHDTVTILFERVLESMSPNEVLNRINRLLTLPIPTEGGFEVAETQRWVEPFDEIWRIKEITVSTDFDRTKWEAMVENMLRIIRSGSRVARERAISRLGILYQIKSLTAEETEEFARAIWSRIDSQTQLPTETNVEMYGFLLSLPNLNIEETKKLIRSYLTEQEFPRVMKRHLDENGQGAIAVSFGTGANSLINNIIRVTLQPYSTDEQKENLIDWSEDEIKNFFGKIIVLWNEDLPYLSRFAGQDLAGDNVRRQFLQLADLFALVLLPRLTSTDVETKKTLKRVLNEMESQELFPLSALPARLFIAPEEVDDISSNVLTGLRHADEEVVSNAAHGTRRWLLFARKSSLIEFPKRLLNELINIAVLRRQPGLLAVIKILAWITENFPEEFSEIQLLDLTETLEFLKIEAFSLSFNSQSEGGESKIISEDEQSEFQEPCQRIAKGLKLFYENANNSVPDIVEFWINYK